MMRLFIAFPLAEEVEERLGGIIDDLKSRGGRIKWVEPKNIHLTARFLGDTQESLVGKLSELLDSVAAEYQAVSTTINGLGAFPNLSRPRVIWAGLGENTESLAKIAGDVEMGVRRLRFKKEPKRFKPHLTLGRVKDPSGLQELIAYIESYTVEEIPVLFDRLVLFKSTLTPQGPIYERLHEAMLKND